MSEDTEKTWEFCLTPADVGRLPERLASVVRYAEARGLRIGSITLTIEAERGQEPAAIRLRKWLKHCGRDCGLRATWPAEKAA